MTSVSEFVTPYLSTVLRCIARLPEDPRLTGGTRLGGPNAPLADTKHTFWTDRTRTQEAAMTSASELVTPCHQHIAKQLTQAQEGRLHTNLADALSLR